MNCERKPGNKLKWNFLTKKINQLKKTCNDEEDPPSPFNFVHTKHVGLKWYKFVVYQTFFPIPDASYLSIESTNERVTKDAHKEWQTEDNKCVPSCSSCCQFRFHHQITWYEKDISSLKQEKSSSHLFLVQESFPGKDKQVWEWNDSERNLSIKIDK